MCVHVVTIIASSVQTIRNQRNTHIEHIHNQVPKIPDQFRDEYRFLKLI